MPKPTPKKPTKKATPPKPAPKKVTAPPAKPVKKPTPPAKKPTPSTKKAAKPADLKKAVAKAQAPKPVVRQKGDIYLQWASAADYDRMLQFYLDELYKVPEYIAHPALRQGLAEDPETFRPQLLRAAIATIQPTFQPNSRISAAFLCMERGRGVPEILGMFRVAATAAQSLSILDLLVAEKHRRKGYGTMLMKGILAEAAKNSFIEVSMSASVANPAAEPFLEKFGLQPYSLFFARDIVPEPQVEPEVRQRVDVGGYQG